MTNSAMDDWVQAVGQRLEVATDLDVDAILDVARDAAHAVERPAAPVTTYLLGLAVAAGANPRTAAEQIADLARIWPPTA